MSRPVVPYVSNVPHLTFVTIANPFHLLGTVFFYPVHLLSVILAQPFELLALVLLDIVQHLIDLFPSGRRTDSSAAETPLQTAASETKRNKQFRRCNENRVFQSG